MPLNMLRGHGNGWDGWSSQWQNWYINLEQDNCDKRVVSAPAAHHAVHGQHRPATAAAAGARGRGAGAAVKGLPQV